MGALFYFNPYRNISLVGFVIAPTFLFVLIFAAGLSIIHVTTESTTYSIVASIIPANVRGKYFGYYNTVFFLSWGLGATFLTGPIADTLIASGNTAVFAYTVSFVAAAILMFFGLLITMFLYYKNKNNLISLHKPSPNVKSISS